MDLTLGWGTNCSINRLQQHRSSLEELPHIQGQGRQPRGATPHPRSGAAAKRSYPMPEVRVVAKMSNRTSKERWLCGCRRAEKGYSTFKVRRGGREEIPLVQGKEHRLCFPGAVMKDTTHPR